MNRALRRVSWLVVSMVAHGAAHPAAPAAAPAYHLITPSEAAQTVVLTGHDLTSEQVVQVMLEAMVTDRIR